MSPVDVYRKDWLGTGGSSRGLNEELGKIPEPDPPSLPGRFYNYVHVGCTLG